MINQIISNSLSSKRSQFLKRYGIHCNETSCSSQVIVVTEKLIKNSVFKRFLILLAAQKIPVIIIKDEDHIDKQLIQIKHKLSKHFIRTSFIVFGTKQMAEKSFNLSDLFIRTDRLENIDEKALIARIIKFAKKEVD